MSNWNPQLNHEDIIGNFPCLSPHLSASILPHLPYRSLSFCHLKRICSCISALLLNTSLCLLGINTFSYIICFLGWSCSPGWCVILRFCVCVCLSSPWSGSFLGFFNLLCLCWHWQFFKIYFDDVCWQEDFRIHIRCFSGHYSHNLLMMQMSYPHWLLD